MRLPLPFGRTRSDQRSLLEDDRAIEGLPIRLIIALVVGVAALSVMMSMVTGIGGLGTTELDAEPEPDVIDLGDWSYGDSVTITVVDEDGSTVEGATVILQGESAQLRGGARHDETGSDGSVTFDGVRPTLAANQAQGELAIDIQPPAGSDYEDQRENTKILVLDG